MSLGFQKAVGFLLLILLGLLLQKKIANEQNLKGIKVLILSVALPATIFVALLKIELEMSLIILPVLALLFNFILLGSSNFLLSGFGVKKNSAKHRTLLMLLPSLAPGLSCFPFIIEFLGDGELAMAAVADVGNKVFVLILLYMLAMHWYHLQFKSSQQEVGASKIKSLLLSLINEPINMVMIVAFVLLAFGIHLSSFPVFLENTILRLSTMMTPLVLLFIGMAVKIKWKELKTIFFLLTLRSGITFLLSAAFIYFFPALTPAIALLVIVFPQSSCSFWPFAHMSAVNSLEEKNKNLNNTFNTNLALSVLALSLPFSTLLIIGIFSFQTVFLNPFIVAAIGMGLIGVSIIPIIVKAIQTTTTSDRSIKEIPFFNRMIEDLRSKKAS
ncbi:permease [Fulvivirga lutimaris]|uniref:permease n=1 Tax=Fulvivirga lutimaris TaxID=1819566 RepID=UPI0016238A8A|nr:permease [Fulvivirga lutimaris]